VEGESPLLANLGVPVTNWQLVTADHARTVFERGKVLRCGVRYSLTCRDVQRVASPKASICALLEDP
jgi:alkylated DNA repair protein alkB homolog 6